MSKSPFEQVGWYIEKREYDKARAILKTMPGSVTAQKWLKKIDDLESPPLRIEPLPLEEKVNQSAPREDVSASVLEEKVSRKMLSDEINQSALPEKVKRVPLTEDIHLVLDQEIEKARNGGRIAGVIITLMGAGIMLFMLLANPFMPSSSRYGSYGTPPSSNDYFFTVLFVGLGLLFFCVGLYQIWYSNHTDKIRATLLKGKAKNIKRVGFMFLGLAALQGMMGLFTGQATNLGTSVMWGIAAGSLLLYQLPKAQAFDRQMALLRDGEKAKRF